MQDIFGELELFQRKGDFAPLDEHGYREVLATDSVVELTLWIQRLAEKHMIRRLSEGQTSFSSLEIDAPHLAAKYIKIKYLPAKVLEQEMFESARVLSFEIFEIPMKWNDWKFAQSYLESNPNLYTKLDSIRENCTILHNVLEYQSNPHLICEITNHLLHRAYLLLLLEDCFHHVNIGHDVLSFLSLRKDSTPVVNTLSTIDRGNMTPLLIALQNQKGNHILHLLRLLHLSGAQKTTLTKLYDQNTCLHFACRYQQGVVAFDCISYLLKIGASDCINFSNKSKFTPLMLTLRYQTDPIYTVEIVKALVAAGANVTIPGPQDYTPLMMVARCQRGLHVITLVQILFKAGADLTLNLKSAKGWTFLSLVEKFQRSKILHEILELCTDEDDGGFT